ncbi:MBL fold metallo-hydrolase [Nocardia sp. NBC_01499]|uniref:MBL fold metallo-hydrolase n=1 Tax=Nocardia sp. NBC_01499 TaxID=2903597 RepID=UPI00386AF9F2
MPATSATAPSWTVGDLTIHRIDEIALPAHTGAWLLPAATPELVTEQRWLHPDFAEADGTLNLNSHTFAATIDGLRVLIDTGIGNGKTRANPAWNNLDTDYLQRLVAAGYPPESIDLVVLTHLHTDHVGWNTHQHNDTWVPTFPNARYLTSSTEWQFWADYDMDQPRRQMFDDSIHPINDAGLLDILDVPDSGLDVVPGLRLLPTPGHTPGHLAVQLSSRDHTALITGDCIHHPVQFADPTIGSCVDIDPGQAETSRRALLQSLTGTDTLILGTHFPPPSTGFVVNNETTYRLIPTSD